MTAPERPPIMLHRNQDIGRRVRDTRRRVARDGAVVYAASDARTLRKLEATLLDEPGMVPHLHKKDGVVRLVVTREIGPDSPYAKWAQWLAGEPVSWFPGTP